ncbi:MAG: Gfo/Idh/MocA family oxidoreductase [Pelotomaculum sp.]|uniref:Predicted dehydrogenases and related proteins n=1 Tax=Pelotomaculum thermopropionicum (strain DSM 13744 / JCM 10971 / SI) TaxID=370438 RepID=A5D5E1_PELTS|nr:Gfo/Idh/MocA family oxidoreductase [Pelotomaculum sp.]BAF58560.1 predicted dehydrogenases and related proteins [Pelotomaculum thermopropionicum SI]
MNVGVVGVGTMGRNHVRVYSELKDVEKIFVFDVNKEAARKIKDHFGEGVVVSDSIASLLNNVEALSICTSTEYHYEIVQRAIEKGVSFLVEKPLTLTLKEGESLLGLVNGNIIAGVGHIERFNPIMKEIKNLIKNPRYIEIKRHNPASARIDDADVVFDLMIHDIDLVWNYFINDISSCELYSVWDKDLCKAIARFGNCTVSLSASRIACKKVRAIYIEDEDFSVDGDFMTQEVYIYRKPQKYGQNSQRYVQENIIEKVLVNKVEPLKEELRTFVDCVKRQEHFPVTLEQAVASLRIAEEILEKGIRREYDILQAPVGHRGERRNWRRHKNLALRAR